MNTKFITIYHWAPIGSNLSYFHGFGVKKVQSTCLILDLIQHRIQKLCEGEANEHEIYMLIYIAGLPDSDSSRFRQPSLS